VSRGVARAGMSWIRSQLPCAEGRCLVAEVEWTHKVEGAMIKRARRHDGHEWNDDELMYSLQRTKLAAD
jgi:hypothetical protein